MSTEENVTIPSSEAYEGIPRSDHVIPGFHVYDGVSYPGMFPKEALDGVKKFQFRDDDVVLTGYPKSGNNWMGQILYLIHNGGVPVAYDDILMKYVFQLGRGISGTHNPVLPDNMPSPRLLRSRLDVKFFQNAIENKKTKFIVIMRNIKDVLVSYYHMHRSMEILGKFKGSFPEFVGMYKEGRLQDWFDWNLGWWRYREYPNILFVKYEELKRDLSGQVRRIMKYLNLDANDDIIFRICQNASFQQMKTDISTCEFFNCLYDDNVSPFMRKGQIGDWKTHFTPKINEYIDHLCSERLDGSGLHFDFE